MRIVRMVVLVVCCAPSTRSVTSRGVIALVNGNPGRKLLKGAEIYALEQLQWRVTRPRGPYRKKSLSALTFAPAMSPGAFT